MIVRRCILLFSISFSLGMGQLWGQTPCAWFDHNGDGFLGANTWLSVLGQYGTDGPMDLDGNGLVDASDLVSFVPYFGHSCPVAWHDTVAEPHLLGLNLVEWALHDEPLAGLVGDLPAGAVTYRLYAEVAEPTDRVLAGFGLAGAPLTFETDGAFFGFGVDGPLDAFVVSDVEPMFNSFAPANAFTSWFSLGAEPGESGTISFVDPPGTSFSESLSWSDSIGGAWFDTGYPQHPPSENGHILLGQFTLIGSTSFSGTLNLLLESYPDAGDHTIEVNYGLSFSTDDLSSMGCTDPAALNFDPEATLDSGDCLIAGDVDGDGVLSTSDLLIFIGEFGCEGCPNADFDGDGIVSIQDFLLFLNWW